MNQSPAPEISVVVPVYGCKEALHELWVRLEGAIAPSGVAFELILVNDDCPHGSWAEIRRLAQADHRIKGIALSRNFGQHYAITAGLDHASGNWIVVMDCDLQDRPEEIPALYAKAQEGFDLVVALRGGRQDSLFRRLVSAAFFKVLNYMLGTRMDPRMNNFGIYSRKVIHAICAMRERNRNFALFANWVGFRRTELVVQHAARSHGASSYTLSRLASVAFDSLIAYTNKPLKFFVGAGFAFASASFVFGLWLIVRHFLFDVGVEGWTSVMVSLYFSTGLIISCMGAIGLYVAKVFDEVKERPLYIVSETTFNRPPE